MRPTISIADSAGAVTEDSATPTLTDSAHHHVRRPRPDGHASATSVAAAAGGNTSGGTLTASVTDPAHGRGRTAPVTSNYSLADGASAVLWLLGRNT